MSFENLIEGEDYRLNVVIADASMGEPLRDGSGKEIGMMGKRRDEMLTDSFDTAEDRMIADLLFYWMNDGSHSIPDDLYIDSFSDAIPRYRRGFREIFERAGHGAHYDMMMGVGSQSSSQEVE